MLIIRKNETLEQAHDRCYAWCVKLGVNMNLIYDVVSRADITGGPIKGCDPAWTMVFLGVKSFNRAKDVAGAMKHYEVVLPYDSTQIFMITRSIAESCVDSRKLTDKQKKFALSFEDSGHYDWLVLATTKEIRDWAKVGLGD